jgi:hypothetical protein
MRLEHKQLNWWRIDKQDDLYCSNLVTVLSLNSFLRIFLGQMHAIVSEATVCLYLIYKSSPYARADKYEFLVTVC